MRRGPTSILLLACLSSSACGSPASRDALLQAAFVTAVVAGEIATAAAENAQAQQEAKRQRQLQRQQEASHRALDQWRLVRRYDPDDESDDSEESGSTAADDEDAASNSNSTQSNVDESSDTDLPVGHCMVCK